MWSYLHVIYFFFLTSPMTSNTFLSKLHYLLLLFLLIIHEVKKKSYQYVHVALVYMWEGISQSTGNLPVATYSKRNNSQSLSQLPTATSCSVRRGPWRVLQPFMLELGLVLSCVSNHSWHEAHEFHSYGLTQRQHLTHSAPPHLTFYLIYHMFLEWWCWGWLMLIADFQLNIQSFIFNIDTNYVSLH